VRLRNRGARLREPMFEICNDDCREGVILTLTELRDNPDVDYHF
jgi:hypothetical protein